MIRSANVFNMPVLYRHTCPMCYRNFADRCVWSPVLMSLSYLHRMAPSKQWRHRPYDLAGRPQGAASSAGGGDYLASRQQGPAPYSPLVAGGTSSSSSDLLPPYPPLVAGGSSSSSSDLLPSYPPLVAGGSSSSSSDLLPSYPPLVAGYGGIASVVPPLPDPYLFRTDPIPDWEGFDPVEVHRAAIESMQYSTAANGFGCTLGDGTADPIGGHWSGSGTADDPIVDCGVAGPSGSDGQFNRPAYRPVVLPTGTSTAVKPVCRVIPVRRLPPAVVVSDAETSDDDDDRRHPPYIPDWADEQSQSD